MLFENVLPLIRAGKWARRLAWSGTKCIGLHVPPDIRRLPYLVYWIDGLYCPWVAKQRDLLEGDWHCVQFGEEIPADD